MLIADSWSLGVLIGLPIAIVCFVACVAVAVAAKRSRDYEAGFIFWAGVVGALAVVVVCAFGYYPYGGEYHKWVDTTGTVSHVAKRIVSDGDKGINQKIVVRYADGRERGCNDTRCSLVKRGDTLSLACKRTWQYAGEDGYDCNFVSLRTRR